MKGPELIAHLKANGLLAKGINISPSYAQGATLSRLCDDRLLEGGLSVASDVQPDEAIGSLCLAVGGSARHLRVLDVLKSPEPRMVISVNDREDEFELRDVPRLVADLDRLFADDADAKAVIVLGEWENSWQLWCVPKPFLVRLVSSEVIDVDQLSGLSV